jgi:hypothetical protein
MATQAVFRERRDELNKLVRGWDRRLRLQQAALWLPRCLLPGLVAGIAIALFSRFRPWLMSSQIALATIIMLALGVLVMLLVVWMWPRSSMVAARRFDVTFGLGERVSTALELIDGRIRAAEELVALQVDDAWAKARTVRAGEKLPLIWRWREWAVVLLLALVLVVLLFIPNPQETAIADNAAQQATIEAAAEELRQITEDVASDAALAPEDREQLLEALEASREVLEQPNVTPEEAFAALSDAQATLQEKSDQLNQQAAAQQAALQAASDALQNARPTEAQGEQQGQVTAADSLQSLADQIPSMSQAQQQALAQALQQAAEQLQATNPAAAEALRQAAEALQNGNPGAAQQSMQQAAQDLANAQQSSQSQSESAQQLSQSAQSAQQAAEQVSQQSQSSGQSGQQSSQGQQSGQQQSQQSGEEGGQESEGQQSGQSQGGGQQSGEQTDSGQGSQPGDQQGQGGEGEGGQPGNQSSEGGQSNQSAGGTGSAQEGEPSDAASNTTGSGAGDAVGGEGSDQANTAGSSGGAQQDNSPDGTGEGQFDPVYAPQRIGGQSSQDIVLDPDASDAPLQEGEFAENPAGNASVPYNQVFSDYSSAANRALESDYIPLGLRDVVRDYFSSLEPGQNSSSNRQP